MPTFNVTLEGRGPVKITDQNYVAQGGEGTIYKVAGTVVKIFSDAAKAQEMRDKMKAFSRLKHAYIAAPEGMVVNGKGPVGIYMPFIAGTALSLVFTNEFRNREHFTDKDASTLTDRIREVFVFAHQNQAILVDPNELNWLTELKKEPEPRVIDVDSWCLDGKIPATVPKMPSIRDWHGKAVSEASDWFAFAVITFQIYVGLHPFKGRLDGYKLSEMERRMKDNASIFTKGVHLNQAVRDVSCIPPKLLDWYRTVFSTSDRPLPPSPFEASKATPVAIQVLRTVTTATGRVKYEKLLPKISEPIVRIFPCGVVATAHSLIDLATNAVIGSVESVADCELIRVDGGWLLNDEYVFSYIPQEGASDQLMGHLEDQKAVVSENRMFLVTDRGLTEYTFRMFGRPVLAPGNTWGAMRNSTKWFDGCGIMDALGATFLIAPFGANACAQVRIPELDGLKPLVAKAGKQFVSVIALDLKGEYRKLELTFSQDYSTYQCWSGIAPSAELNLTILPKGVCATIVNDGELVIFVPRNGAINKALDSKVNTGMILGRWDNTVLVIQNGAVWKISLT